jgi:hypothetical protein
MNTMFIGIKDFRQNMAMYAKKAQKRTTRFVVMNRNVPLFEVTPFDEDATLENVFDKVIAAKAEVAAGKFYTHAEVKASLEK